MIAADLVREVRGHGVRLVPDQGTLRLSGKAPLPDELMARLKTHKPAVLRQLHAEATAAEWKSRVELLDPERPPSHAPDRWWEDVCGCAVTFCEEWGVQAVLLGWDAYSLFGADRARPYARTDMCGLVGFLPRKQVVAMTEDTVTMAVAWHEDARQVYRRVDLSRTPGAVLLWELRPDD